ncbi:MULTISPECIES: hypothetical protein [Burkholderiaceae]|jgi:hypothetical protein|uniref:Uncharacterized protein n=1 Tax=Caballeronia sordidicola TaxID=196367 RepID=A0A242MWL5_CABSO|nr:MULTISPECIES: hypothetical protein [Burkholderiaceae]AME25705.1 hypothetical protein AXG89_17210 [Burkholderia sp. PAMC 26561]OTP75276.1 hypothetical protein PAMC26577_13460 [Caballeronia sordidicola]
MLKKLIQFLIGFGCVLACTGIGVLALGFLGVVNVERFAFGLSAGVRIVGSVAIAGCLLCAIGYGLEENT